MATNYKLSDGSDLDSRYIQKVNGSGPDSNGNVTVSVSGGGTSAYQIPFASCTTAASTGAKVATISNSMSFSLIEGAVVAVKYTKSPSYCTTLNVDSTGAKTVKRYISYVGTSSNSTDHEFYSSNSVYLYVYDGTYWNEFVYAYSYTPDDGQD